MEKQIIATIYPLKFIDVANKLVPIFYIPKDYIDRFKPHTCLDYLHFPCTGQVVEINEETKLGDILGRTSDIYIAKTSPDKTWELLSVNQINSLYVNTNVIWDFTADNEFNKVFKEERARRQEKKNEVVNNQEGFIRPSLLYRFEDGVTINFFDSGTPAFIDSLNNPQYSRVIFNTMLTFLKNPLAKSCTNEPFRDFIKVEPLASGTSQVRSLLFSTDTADYFIKLGISTLRVSDNVYYLAVSKDDKTESIFEYDFYTLTSSMNLDHFFRLFSKVFRLGV